MVGVGRKRREEGVHPCLPGGFQSRCFRFLEAGGCVGREVKLFFTLLVYEEIYGFSDGFLEVPDFWRLFNSLR